MGVGTFCFFLIIIVVELASFLKFKSETFLNFKKFAAFADNQSGKKLNALRLDRSGEFMSNEFIVFCDENRIHKQLTAPYTPK